MRIPKMTLELPKIKISKTILVQFIPIVMFTLFLLYPVKTVHYSRSLLGKILVAFIILFYTTVDPLYGILCCGVIILFYQTIYEFNQHTEGMDTNCNKNTPEKRDEKVMESSDSSGWKYVANNLAISNVGNATGEETCLIDNGDPANQVGGNIKFEEGMVTYSTQEKKANNTDEKMETQSSEFKEHHCDNGVLRYKVSKVNLDMASLVFPQLQFKGKPCNPCDTSCEYSIDNKIVKEEEMLKPKESNSWFNFVWNSVWKSNKNEVKEYDGKIKTPSTLFIQ